MLRLYQIENQADQAFRDADGTIPYFSSKFQAREFRDQVNEANQAAGSEETFHIAPGPDHKKKTGEKRKWSEAS